MEKNNNGLLVKILVVITFLGMVAVNALANILPINGVTTGGVSDSYPNIFAPAGLTFAIWGVIYLLLAAYTLYQAGLFQGNKDTVKKGLISKVSAVFIISSIVNTAWIFSWHYYMIPLSMALMAALLVCLIIINKKLSKETLTLREKFFIRLPFSVYFGWITVAIIANATVLLVSLNWDAFGISETVWACAVITVGMVIGSLTMLKHKDIAYGLVLIWAYLGILIKHISTFNGEYPAVIAVVIACMVIFAAVELFIILPRIKKRA